MYISDYTIFLGQQPDVAEISVNAQKMDITEIMKTGRGKNIPYKSCLFIS